jgi:branched-chain amino acid aminotransferase
MISGNYFLKNHDICQKEEFVNPFKKGSINIYEVVRVDGGIPIFIEDHLIRFNNSLLVAGKKLLLSEYRVTEQVRRLIEINKIEDGLIRIVFSFSNNNSVVLTTFQTRVTFPPIEYYKKGVSCLLQHSERDNPSAKIFNPEVRGKANSMISSRNVYETILVNSEGEITEGSRSNVFFIKDKAIYTAPNDLVLQGITRQKVINIINSFGIHLQLTTVNVNRLKDMDAMFITGTTPKVLPVNKIDGIEFGTNNTIVTQLMQAYNSMVYEYKRIT